MTSLKEGPEDLLEGRTPVELRSKGYAGTYVQYVRTGAQNTHVR